MRDDHPVSDPRTAATAREALEHDHRMGGFCERPDCIRLGFYRDLRRMDMTKWPLSAEDIASGIEAVWIDGWTVGVRGAAAAEARPNAPAATARERDVERVLAEALHIPEWPCDHRQYDPPQCVRAARSIFAGSPTLPAALAAAEAPGRVSEFRTSESNGPVSDSFACGFGIESCPGVVGECQVAAEAPGRVAALEAAFRITRDELMDWEHHEDCEVWQHYDREPSAAEGPCDCSLAGLVNRLTLAIGENDRG